MLMNSTGLYRRFTLTGVHIKKNHHMRLDISGFSCMFVTGINNITYDIKENNVPTGTNEDILEKH